MLIKIIVPVLDGRTHKFNLEGDLFILDKILPPFHQEVPEGSFAWVGYAVNKFNAAKGISLRFNLMWVVVVGVNGDA
jgi:hypothetical protein